LTGPGDEEMRPERSGDPSVSVIIPAYNHQDYVGEAIESVLAQTHADLELILINDGSTDETDARIRGYDDPRIKYFTQQNIGAAPTINLGISRAVGEFIHILNSDDVYAPDRIERILRQFEDDETLDAVVTHLEFIDGDGKRMSIQECPDHVWRERRATPSFRDSDELLLHLLAGNFACTTSNIACRRRVFEELGGFRNLRYLHDYEFLLRLCYHKKVRALPEVLVRYRIHAQNTIKENEGQTDFEFGVVLASFLLDNDLSRFFPEADPDEVALRFFHSLETRNAAKLLITVLTLGHHGILRTETLGSLAETQDGAFRAACVRYFLSYVDAWNSAQDGWAKWREVNDRLVAVDREFQGHLAASNEQIRTLLAENKRVFEEVQATTENLRELSARYEELDGRHASTLEENKRVFAESQNLRSENERVFAESRMLQEENDAVRAQLQAQREDYQERLAELASAQAELAGARLELERVYRTVAWRLGRAITWPLRKVWRWMRGSG